jgi:hypothetical protein
MELQAGLPALDFGGIRHAAAARLCTSFEDRPNALDGRRRLDGPDYRPFSHVAISQVGIRRGKFCAHRIIPAAERRTWPAQVIDHIIYLAVREEYSWFDVQGRARQEIGAAKSNASVVTRQAQPNDRRV